MTDFPIPRTAAQSVGQGHPAAAEDVSARSLRRTGARRPRWRDYTAFVLSGGGARGALQVGALRALLEYGEHADIVVGTSAGAWNGAMLARTPTLEGVERLAAAWRSTNPASVLLGWELPHGRSQQAIRGVLTVAMARRVASGAPSLYSDVGLRLLIEQNLGGDPTFEELALPLSIIATDLTHAERRVFTSGLVVPAVMASSAIPGIFPPVRIGEELYVDGGALDNCSLDTALRLGARRLFVIDVGYNDGAHVPPHLAQPAHHGRPRRMATPPVAAILERTSQAMNRYHLERALERVPRGVETHVLRLSTQSHGGSLGFGSAKELIEEGYAQTCAYLCQALPQRRISAGTPTPDGSASDGSASVPAASTPMTSGNG
ncbi:MAG: patatin-like phospholipase family protein [Ktedonobacterales bacterium]|nr:patatin-like phospholipase family protein [Ktedonobacterales bacterium]